MQTTVYIILSMEKQHVLIHHENIPIQTELQIVVTLWMAKMLPQPIPEQMAIILHYPIL